MATDAPTAERKIVMSYFWCCPDCGANLDPGERCDCRDLTVGNPQSAMPTAPFQGGGIPSVGGVAVVGSAVGGTGNPSPTVMVAGVEKKESSSAEVEVRQTSKRV